MRNILVGAICLLGIPLFQSCQELFLEADEIIVAPESSEGFKPIYSRDLPPGFIPAFQALQPQDTMARLQTQFVVTKVNGFRRFIAVWGEGLAVIEQDSSGQISNARFLNIEGLIDYKRQSNQLLLFFRNHEIRLTLTETNISVGNPTSSQAKIDPYRPLRRIPSNHTQFDSIGTYVECYDSEKGYILRWQESILDKPDCYVQ